MTDFVTPVADLSALVAWYGTIPGTVPVGDRYIAELAAGNYDLTGVTWTGKTCSAVGAITIRAAAGARPASPNTNPARFEASGRATLRTSFGGSNTYGCSFDGGLVFEDIQIACVTNGGNNFQSGCLLQRCVTYKSFNATLQMSGNARMRNSLCITTVPNTAMGFAGNGDVTNNTFISFADFAAVFLSGSYQNAVWKNNLAFNVGGTADPWPSPPTNFFASSSNNGTNFATAGNCPGTSALVGIVPSDALVNVASAATLNARPKGGSVLFGAGVVAAANGGTDYYSDARGGSTITVGAVELTSSPVPSILDGGATLGDVAASGGIVSVASSLAGNITLDDVAATGAIGLAPGTITSEVLKDNTGTVLANLGLNHYSVYHDATGALVVRKTGLTTNGAGVVTFSDAAVVPGTTYRHDWETVAGHRRMPRKAAT